MTAQYPFKLSVAAIAITAALSACSSSGGGDTTISKSGNVLSNGYLKFATVCLDTNNNKTCDETGDLKTESDANGAFTLNALAEQYAQYAIIAESNSNTADDNGPVTEKLVLSTPPGKTEPTTGDVTVSPLTTLIQGYQQANLGLSAEAAEEQVKTNLGIDDDNVSLFDDYVKKLQDLASSGSGKSIATGAVATGALSNAEVYTLFSQVAEVTTETIQQAIADVIADTTAGIDLGDELDSLIAVIVDDVVEALPQMVTEIAALPADQPFDPAALVTSLNLEVDLTTLAEAIAAQEQINTATATGMEAIIQDGLNFFNAGFFSEAPVITRESISFGSNGTDKTTLSSTLTAFDPLNAAVGFTTPTNSGPNDELYLSATTGWTPSQPNNTDGASVTLNADGSASINAPDGSSFKVSGAVTDVSGLKVVDFLPQDGSTQPSTNTTTFSTGAKAIRFSGVILADNYFLSASSQVDTSGGNGPQAITLGNLITSTPFDLTTNTDAVQTNDTNPVGDVIGCDFNGNTCIAFEFVGTDTSGNVGTSGPTNFYKFDFTQTSPTGWHVITKLPDTSTWSITSLNGETILTSQYPAAIKSQLLGFGNGGDNEAGILFSVYDNGTGSAVRRGGFETAGSAFADSEWAFNNTAADDVEQVIISELTIATNEPFITDTTVLTASSGSFLMNLFMYDFASDTANIIATDQSFTRAADFSMPAVGDTFDLTLNLPDPQTAGNIVTEIHQLTIDTVDAATGTTGTATEQIVDATGTPLPNTSPNPATFAMQANGEIQFEIDDSTIGERIIARLVPVTGNSTSPAIDVVIITRNVSLQDTTNRLTESVITGVLAPVAPL